jgi:hypothetical protein
MPGVGSHDKYFVYNQDVGTALRAAAERIFYVKGPNGYYPPPQPTASFREELRRVYQHFVKFATPVGMITFEEYIASVVPKKRKTYTNAMNSLRVRPLTRDDAVVTMFVKNEKYNFTTKEDPTPRCISTRDPRFHIMLGRHLKPVEHNIYHLVDDLYGTRTITKGMNALDKGELIYRKWKMFDDPVAIPMDAKRFDQHFSEEAFKFCHSIYMLMVPAHEKAHLNRLLQFQLNNIVKCVCKDGMFTYEAGAKKMSGDVDTALGNCLIMASMIYCWLVHALGTTGKFQVMDDGDDSVIIVERADYKRATLGLEEWFLSLGFEMDVEAPVDVLEHIDYCQSRPVLVTMDSGETVCLMVRHHDVVTKDLTSLKHIKDPRDARDWYKAVSDCGVSANPGVPVLQEFYQMFDVATRHQRGRGNIDIEDMGIARMSAGMTLKSSVHWQSRVSYAIAFGIPPNKQRAMENRFRRHHVDLSGTMRQQPTGADWW